MPLTILEGPDGGGKTTLTGRWASQLERQAGVTVTRVNHGPYLGTVDLAPKYLAGLMPQRGWHTLMDRCWLSEHVYGPIVRHANRIGPAEQRALERVALSAQPLVVWCLPSYAACERAYLARRELEYLKDEGQLRRVYDEFARLAVDDHTTALPTVTYNWEREPHVESFFDFAREMRWAPNDGPGVGAYRPGVTLMVGEQVSNETAALPLPFVSWDQGGCVAWLSEKLEAWGVSERDLYWINALDLKGRGTQAGEWLDRLAPRRVIALGSVAEAWCRQHVHGNTRGVPHPQWWKRFKHHDESYPLREALTC